MNASSDGPSFDDQVAAIDATAAAAKMRHGGRRAIQASVIEIVAVARRLLALDHIAGLVVDMLVAADTAAEEMDAEARAALKRQLTRKIDLVGASLEALGYGAPQPQPQQQEKPDGEG